ncbi:Protein DGCR14 like protein [Habropoda laboriosa]|uniref:Protein DGCR14 like protein n=1 Tax=Habropoda laboriosa TaxID=597456 RepID=A0A0L7QL02_9HYME|nr:Protein DGCR14 like protein [Habropoda laboriosa]
MCAKLSYSNNAVIELIRSIGLLDSNGEHIMAPHDIPKRGSTMNSPGSQALEVAKNMKDLAVFKKPIGVAKKYKKVQPKILDEDTYIKRMGEIIQRDFFPHLDKLQAQNQYLDALEQNDVKRMRELYEKYSSGRPTTERPASPATFETPMNKTESEDEQFKSSKIPKETPVNTVTKDKDKTEIKTGLDAYLSTHTSEDNASFEEMMIEAEKRLKLKFAWLYEAEENSKALTNNSSDTLAIENGNEKPNQLDSWTYKNKNYIMYVPDGVELTPDERIDLAKKRQMVMHENTRLRINPFNEQQNKETINELAKNQSKANDGKIGVDGKEIVRNPTPRVNGFSFVATPSPRPGECESPLMTWGQIEGTPFRLDGGDTPLLRTSQGPSFRMAEPPKREQLALQLAEKAGERHRDRKSKALEAARKSLATPSPRSTIDRLSTMSPAARRLATQKLRIASTPTPRRTSSSRTPSIGIRTPSTPRINTPSKSENHLESEHGSTRCQGPVLTDNLLNLPLQRQRAADFFNK